MLQGHCATLACEDTIPEFDAGSQAARVSRFSVINGMSDRTLVFDTKHRPGEIGTDNRTVRLRRSAEDISDAAGQRNAMDCALMLRVVARDRQAFALLAERHATVALSLAQRIVRNPADAEDVVQESLTRLWIFADRWNPEMARFSSWYYRIVTNQAISRLRRKTPDPIDSIPEPSDTAPGPHDQFAGREIGHAIDGAVARLPARQRVAIALCYDQGLSCAEAAEAMHVSVGTMESLLFRARRSLRDWLSPLGAELRER